MISSNLIKLIIFIVVVIIISSNQNYFIGVNKIYKTLKKIPHIMMIVSGLLAFFGIGIYNPFQSQKIDFGDSLTDQKDFKEKDFSINKIKNIIFEPNEDSITKKQKRKVTDSTKKLVASNQQWRCAICHCILDETYEVDHIIPLYKNGSNEIDNLMALDPICHRKKTNADRLGIPIEKYFTKENTKFCNLNNNYNL